MGIYVHPGNSGFAEINDSDYVDKTMLIEQINQTVGKKNKLTCISRPRRFGKSYAARMLAAYYDCSCDSHTQMNKKRHYPRTFEGYGRDILLVGIAYEKDVPVGQRKHVCKIEKHVISAGND